MPGENGAQVRYERREAAAWLVLDRPQALNSLTPALVQGLAGGLARAEAAGPAGGVGDGGVRCVVITGTGRAFCAGTDLAAARGDHGPFDLAGFLGSFAALLEAIEASPLPVIAAVNGIACAGGLELVLACDLVVAAEEARIGDAHANYGLIPGGGCSVRLPERVGALRARELFFSGDLLPARTLEQWGLVNRVVPAAGLDAEVAAIAAQLAARSPLATARMKRLVAQARELPRHEALQRELELVLEHQQSADMAEGLAAFVEKRAPRFTGS